MNLIEIMLLQLKELNPKLNSSPSMFHYNLQQLEKVPKLRKLVRYDLTKQTSVFLWINFRQISNWCRLKKCI